MMSFALTLPAVAPPAECAAKAAEVLVAYSGRAEPSYSALSDLLTDLAHLAHERGWDFEAEAKNALINVKTERS